MIPAQELPTPLVGMQHHMSPVMPCPPPGSRHHMSPVMSLLRLLLVERDWPIIRSAWVLCLAVLLCLNRAGLALTCLLVGHVGFQRERRRPTDGAFLRRTGWN